MSNVGPQPGSDSAANTPVNGVENSNFNDMIPPVAAPSSASPQPVQSVLDSGTGNVMYHLLCRLTLLKQAPFKMDYREALMTI